jgi:transposase InsO family protein
VLNKSTVYRFLHQQNLMNLTEHKPVDRRKFEAELPDDIWQSDVMHGPKVDVDGMMRKAYLIAIIDDHSRLTTYAHFYLSENLACYLNAFENALARRGLPRKLYVDNGAAAQKALCGQWSGLSQQTPRIHLRFTGNYLDPCQAIHTSGKGKD